MYVAAWRLGAKSIMGLLTLRSRAKPPRQSAFFTRSKFATRPILLQAVGHQSLITNHCAGTGDEQGAQNRKPFDQRVGHRVGRAFEQFTGVQKHQADAGQSCRQPKAERDDQEQAVAYAVQRYG